MVLAITNYCSGLTVLSRSDTLIPTPDTTLRKLVIAAEQSNILKTQIEILEGRELLSQKLISEMDSKYNMMEDFYKGQLDNMRQQGELYKDQIAGYERLLKRQRRKTFFTGAAGFITTGIALYLFAQK